MSDLSVVETQIVFDATRLLIPGVDAGEEYQIIAYLPEFEPRVVVDRDQSRSFDATKYGVLRSRVRAWTCATRHLNAVERPEWEMFLASTDGGEVFAISDRDNDGDIITVVRAPDVQITRIDRRMNLFYYRFTVEEQP